MIRSACCGHPTRRARRPAPPEPPPNPVVRRGTKLLFLGAGAVTLRGKSSGLVYHVSELRRSVIVDPADAPALLRRIDVILAP